MDDFKIPGLFLSAVLGEVATPVIRDVSSQLELHNSINVNVFRPCHVEQELVEQDGS